MLFCQKSLLFLSSFGWVFNKVGKKCNAKRKIQTNKTEFEKLSHASRILATIIYRLNRIIVTVPDMRSRWGFQQFVPNVWFSSRVPMVKLIGLFEDETGTFPITTRLPTLRCKTKVSRAMDPLGQNRSRTSLQDRNPTCKRNLWVHFVARSRSRVQRKPFKLDVRHPWEGSGPLLTKNLTGRHLRHSC